MHTRRSVPQPQLPPVSMAPGEQSPIMPQPPSSTQRPDVHTWRCWPQRSQGIVRATLPSVQSQSVGAVQAAQTVSVQRWTPEPQSLMQVRSAVEPTVASPSSQSRLTGTPSLSRSSSGVAQAPATQICGATHAGVQAPTIASARSAASPPPSLSVEKPSPPWAQADNEMSAATPRMRLNDQRMGGI